ncbi:TPR domain protein [Rhodopirellula islandica]|uniref:TPR domain protein n=1 Tax=Rhodopirellula islandica TaxID=595434 RepID=A0A0J1B626_RHOIS|nr:TPR domain protein [Rhodopirellula islandica]
MEGDEATGIQSRLESQAIGPVGKNDRNSAPLEPEVTLTTSQLRPVADLQAGFVASETCLQCHAEEHQSWDASFHRTMTQIIREETAPESIVNKQVVVNGKRYAFERHEDAFFVTYADPFRGGMVLRRELLMMTGSHHMHVFWHASDHLGTPAQLDIVYLIEEERWIPRDSSFLQPPDHHAGLELGTWNRTCSRCHSTHPRERSNEQTLEWDTRVAEFGIACEACHGEGKGHVLRHSNREDEDSEESLTTEAVTDLVVNPAKLSKRRSADVCGQCHSVFLPDYDVVSLQEYEQTGNPFRPGDRLDEIGFSRVVRATDEHRDSETFQRWSEMEDVGGAFWSDGMPRIAGREYNGLIESACFQQGEMTCLSCHQMHPPEVPGTDRETQLASWRNDQLGQGMAGDDACLQCHAEMGEQIEMHTHHAVDSHGSRCMNCHMPHTTYGLLKTIRSHQISSPSIEQSRVSDRANACSLCHLDRGFHWVANHLHDWYGQPLPDREAPGNEVDLSTSALHLLSGDAAQRAVQVAAMGWAPAQEASGTEWMEPYLLLALNDPYDAIRIVAEKSLRTLPNRVSKPMDAMAPAGQRMHAFNAAIEAIDKSLQMEPKPEVLVDEEGRFDFLRAREFLERRNHQPIHLRE